MNRNITPLILIVLALGIFFTFTNGHIDELKAIQVVNASYLQAINNSVDLIKIRDSVNADYSSLTQDEKDRLNKIVPDNVDNVRLIIDITNIASQHGIALKGITTNAPTVNSAAVSATPNGGTTDQLVDGSVSGTVSVSFSFSASYANFLAFLQSIQSSLRILDISQLSVTANPSGIYDYSITLQTYWLNQ